MADSMADDKRRTLRVEAEVRVRLSGCVQGGKRNCSKTCTAYRATAHPIKSG